MQPVNWANGAVFFSGMPDDDEFDDSSSRVDSPRTPRSNYSSPGSSNPGSTTSTPKKRGRPEGDNDSPVKTPIKVQTLEHVLRSCDAQCDLTAKESKRLLEGVEALPTTRDSPTHPKRAAVAVRVATKSAKALLNLGEDEALDLTKPQTHIALCSALEESPWIGKVLKGASYAHASAVHKSPDDMIRIFNWQHITSHQNGRGMHFLPRNHPDLRLIQHCTVNSAGIYCGILHGKFSTFFPVLDTDEELLEILNRAKPLCKFENRQLQVTWTKENQPLYVESFIQEGVKHQSDFPLFFYSKWEPARAYDVIPGHEPLTSDFILQAAIRLGQKGIRYKNDNSIIVDIAQALPTAAHIQQGIYIEIPCQFLPSDDD